MKSVNDSNGQLGGKCVICKLNGFSQGSFLCEECLKKIFVAGNIAMYCRGCQCQSLITLEEFSMIVKQDLSRIDTGEKILVMIDSCERCSQPGDNPIAEVYHLRPMPEA